MAFGHLGKARRLRRILRPDTGKGIIVAMDHGLFLGPITGLEDLRATMERVIAGSPDGVQVSFGAAHLIADFLQGRHAPALVLRVDVTNIWRSRPEPKEGYHVTLAGVEEALQMDADAVVAFFFIGYETDAQEAENLERLATLANTCRDMGMPFIVEPLVIERGAHVVRDPDRIKLAVRIASEIGADALKVDYTGDPKSFREVVEAATAPILVRGGPRMEMDEAMLQMVKEAMEVGAKGLVFGRNIWQHPNPAALLGALHALVHEDASVDDALKWLKP